MNEIFKDLGPTFIRKSYHMTAESFWKLHCVLHLHLKDTKPCTGGAPNGFISSAVCLSIALCWFAGGSVYDIMLVHGVSYVEIYKSVWKVVDDVNETVSLDIKFPKNHEIQKKIARGFQAKSQVDFLACVGALDGILIWIEKSNEESCEEAQCGPKKFFVGEKRSLD